MTDARNRATIQAAFAALADGDGSVLGAAMHPQFAWQIMGQSSWSRRFEGLASVRGDLFKPLFACLAAGSYRARLRRATAHGDIVVAEVKGEAVTLAGARYDNDYCHVCRFDGEGWLVELLEYSDTDLIERVLGRYEDALARVRG